MLSQLENALIMAIASNPEQARLIVSPSVDMDRHWAQTELGAQFIDVTAQVVLSGAKVAPIHYLSKIKLDEASRNQFKQAWADGQKSPDLDLGVVIEALRNEYLIRDSNKAIAEYQSNVKKYPRAVRSQLDGLARTIDLLSHGGELYDPTPSSHKNAKNFETWHTWGHSTFDQMYDGGIPVSGYSLLVGPSGMGKTTIGFTMAAYLITQQIPVVVCTNEANITAGMGYKRIFRILDTMWAGSRTEADIDKDMDTYMKIYDLSANTHDIHRIDRIAYWDQPKVLIMDSLDNLDFPKETEKLRDDKEKHRLRANYLSEMTANRGFFMSVVGNASGENQELIKKNINKVTMASAFSSTWYFSISSYSFVFCRNRDDGKIADIKRVKNRGESGDIGQMYYMAYNRDGKYYEPTRALPLN